jgi:hypothetical protein
VISKFVKKMMNKIFEQKKKDANDREPGLRKTKYNGLDEIPIKTIDPHVW